MKLIFDKITKQEIYNSIGDDTKSLIVYQDGTLDFFTGKYTVLEPMIAVIPLNMDYVRHTLLSWGLLTDDDKIFMGITKACKCLFIDNFLSEELRLKNCRYA